MSAIKGDFISFTYNGVHSTELGIVRVTSSNRYTDQLVPSLQDKTVQVPGGNGTYFFGSYYTARNITINIAYDSVTENQIRLMRETFSGDAPHELVFDDEPYKVYYAKITGMPQLQYIPFDSEDAIRSRVYDDNTHNYVQSIYERVYKGEGTLTFTCYDPFAHAPYNCKYLNQYTCQKKTPGDFIQGSAPSGTSIGKKKTRIALGKIENGTKVNTYINVTSDTYYKIRTNLPNGFIYELNNDKTWLITRVISNGVKYFKTTEDTKYITVALYVNNTQEMTPSMLTSFSISKPSWYDPSYADNPTKWKSEWIDSAKLLNSNSGYDNNTNDENNIFNLYNPGDVETDFQLIIPFDDNNYMNKITGITANGVTLGIDFTKFVGTIPSLQGYSYHLCFDSKTNLVKVLRRSNTSGKYVETGTIHNEILKQGVWPKIPVTGGIYTEIFEKVNNMNETDYNADPTKYWYIDVDVYINCTANDQYVEERVYYEKKDDGYSPATKKELKINLIDENAVLPTRPTLYYDYLYY